jgi:hypothetical protein
LEALVSEIKAIETKYKGYRFRSRLEARWAVFFDSLGIEWEYEKEGYQVGGGRWYLPDFYLPKWGQWVEVKGDPEALDPDLLADAVDYGRGLPGLENSLGTMRGLILLGDIPYPPDGYLAPHLVLQHDEGGWVQAGIFVGYEGDHAGFLVLHSAFAKYGFSGGGVGDDDDWIAVVRRRLPATQYFPSAHIDVCEWVQRAYTAARSARFEHGETPEGWVA